MWDTCDTGDIVPRSRQCPKKQEKEKRNERSGNKSGTN